ncbi:MAG: hypothetical protein V4649_07085 [Bacteroidota bacterium]
MDKVAVNQKDVVLFVASAALPLDEFKTEFQLLAGKYGVDNYEMSDEEAEHIRQALGEGLIDAILNPVA